MKRPARGQNQSGESHRKHRHTDFAKDVPQLAEDDLYRKVEADANALVLVLDGVTDPHNLGACLRSANAAGVLAVIAPKDRAAGLTETVRHIACGAAEATPFVQVTNLARCLEKLKELGMWIVGTGDEASQSLYSVDLTGRIAIVTGAEGPGMRRLTGEKCDFLVQIPMVGTVPCLNVSVATGICLFESVRQRQVALDAQMADD